MHQEDPLKREVDQFILEEIDSVPHLEALLLLWNSANRRRTLDELAHDLYISVERTGAIMRDLQSRGFVIVQDDLCLWNPECARMSLIEAVDRAWRREIVRISSLIHSKASPSVRQFASAFRFKKPHNPGTGPKKD